MPSGHASLSGKSPVTAVPLLVCNDRFKEVFHAKVGPKCVSHPDLGISNLPEEKIADAEFTAGSHHQVGVRQAGGVEAGGEGRLVDFKRAPIAVDLPIKEELYSIHQLRSPPVV